MSDTEPETEQPTAPEAPPKRGRGRPTAELPADVIERVGPPPTDPLERAVWVNHLLAELVWLECQGRASQKLGARIRATCGVLIRSIPDHIRAELEQRLRGDDKAVAAGARGQAPEAVSRGSQALRG